MSPVYTLGGEGTSPFPFRGRLGWVIEMDRVRTDSSDPSPLKAHYGTILNIRPRKYTATVTVTRAAVVETTPCF